MKYLIGISPLLKIDTTDLESRVRIDVPNCEIIIGWCRNIREYAEENRESILKTVYITNDVKSSLDFFISNDIIDAENKTSEEIVNDILWIFSEFGKERKMTNDTWFTSDTHFYHGNIIKYCNRPWNSGKDSNGEIVITEQDIETMNRQMISRWNRVVGPEDTVWHLGDFCLGKNQSEHIPDIVSKLNGKINLILGNHDHNKLEKYYEWGFHRVYDRKVIINDYVVLSHAPVEFIGPNSPFYNIYGHVHNTENYPTFTKSSCCVCVERWDYAPVSWKTIQEKYNEMNGEKQ